MSIVRNGRHLYNEAPTAHPEPGKTTIQDDSQTIDLDNVPLNGGFLVKTLVLSIDPYQRSLMLAPGGTSTYGSYVYGQPITTFGVGVVIRSEDPDFKPGDHVYGFCQSQEYFIPKDRSKLHVIDNKEKLPWSVYVGAAGMPGQTAYYGMKEFASAKKGEVIFVSTGAGAVGSLVVQLAKSDGLKVIASAGSNEKVEYMKEIGADVAFNYKTTNTAEILKREGPIDIYWDNVGGETLQAALDNAARGGRFIECGMISNWDSQTPPKLDLKPIIYKQLKIFGLLVQTLSEKYEREFYQVMPKLLADGTIKYREDISQGLASMGQGFYEVYAGKNNGKKVIEVADG